MLWSYPYHGQLFLLMPSQVRGREKPGSPVRGEEHLDYLPEETQRSRHSEMQRLERLRAPAQCCRRGREGGREPPNRSCWILLCTLLSVCSVCTQGSTSTQHRAAQHCRWYGDGGMAWGRTSSCVNRQSSKMKSTLCL